MLDSEKRKIDEQKKIFDAITKQWLDEKFRDFGRFTFKAILAVIFIAVLKLIFSLHYSDLRALLETSAQVQDLAK